MFSDENVYFSDRYAAADSVRFEKRTRPQTRITCSRENIYF